MLSLTLATLGFAIVAHAKPTARPVGGLEVSLSTPANEVASASDLRIFATIKNAGDQGLKILKFGTVLDNEHSTRAFIVSKDGKEVPFVGATGPVPAEDLPENDWAVIPAGKNVTVEHSAVSALYDFSAGGPGTFTFDPVSRFQVIRFDDSVKTASDATPIDIPDARSVSITISNRVSNREREIENPRQAQVHCLNPDHNSFVMNSIWEAGYLAAIARWYIDTRGPDYLYQAYFGKNSPETVARNFDNVLHGDLTQTLLSCENSYKCSLTPGISSYREGSAEVHYCPGFFSRLPVTSLCKNPRYTPVARTTRGGSTLSALVSLLGGYNDGSECDPHQKDDGEAMLVNATNYECFATQAVVDAGCSK